MIDLRRIRCAIELNGRMQGMRDYASASGHQICQSAAERMHSVNIDGLNAETRTMLLTETSPFAGNKSSPRIIVGPVVPVPVFSGSTPVILSVPKFHHRRCDVDTEGETGKCQRPRYCVTGRQATGKNE